MPYWWGRGKAQAIPSNPSTPTPSSTVNLAQLAHTLGHLGWGFHLWLPYVV